MFNYEVLTPQQAEQERYQLLKEGEYDAVINVSEDRISQNSGNPMMDMLITCFDENGRPTDVRDFLVFTKKMMWKVINFANSAGVLKEYEDQKLCSDLVIGKRVRVKVGVEQGGLIPSEKLGDRALGSKYPDKNKIVDYIKNENQASGGDGLVDDDVPF